jgi:hypothetical protein
MSAPDGAVTIFAIGGAVVALCCNQQPGTTSMEPARDVFVA